MDVLGLLSRGDLARANGPDGLVGNDDVPGGQYRLKFQRKYSLPVSLANLLGNRLELALTDLVGDALLTLLEGLADTGDNLEANGESSLDLVSDNLVRVAEKGAALRVAENDPRNSGILDLLGRDLASVGSRIDRVRVLGSDLDRGLDRARDIKQVDGRGGDDNLCKSQLH